MTAEIELVPVRKDSHGNVREWRVERQPAAIEPAQAYPVDVPDPGPMATAAIRGSYDDRARGFVRATLPFSAGVMVLSLIAAVVLWNHPLLSFRAWLVAFGGFCLTWLIAYGLHTIVSAEGSQLIATIATANYMRREQRERHRQTRGGRT